MWEIGLKVAFLWFVLSGPSNEGSFIVGAEFSQDSPGIRVGISLAAPLCEGSLSLSTTINSQDSGDQEVWVRLSKGF
jgi:hypothetical protein